jgi:hypothetical protein
MSLDERIDRGRLVEAIRKTNDLADVSRAIAAHTHTHTHYCTA